MPFSYLTQLIRKELESKFRNEKKCKDVSWNEYRLKKACFGNKRNFMTFEENDSSMKTSISPTSKEFIQVKI